ncbi:MAG: ribonuclease P protein component [Chloroflexi bacterium]|nr:ribonuclease P protein component [Chloroflexota bacterium]MCL5273374.1 ribonuclease P protein component [Chloroflexota bacterium]
MLGRLHSPADFERVKRQGSYWGGGRCSINAARRLPPTEQAGGLPLAGETEPARIGLIASRKIGNAVQRNRARRLMRESMRMLASALEPCWDIVVIARPAIAAPGVRMQDVRDELQWLLTKARLMKSV